jgi:antitoxin MazE
MITKVQKWGNSQGLRLSKSLLSDVALIVTPVRRLRGGHNLRDLVRRVPKGYRAQELDWGQPVGNEGW